MDNFKSKLNALFSFEQKESVPNSIECVFELINKNKILISAR